MRRDKTRDRPLGGTSGRCAVLTGVPVCAARTRGRPARTSAPLSCRRATR